MEASAECMRVHGVGERAHVCVYTQRGKEQEKYRDIATKNSIESE